MRGIIATNNKNVIGIDQFLPWKSAEDLSHFKNLTMGCNLLVGYNTYVKMPILRGRKLFVETLSKRRPLYYENYDLFNFPFINSDYSIVEDRYVNYVNSETINNVSIDWCIGGKKTFEKYCHLFTELHISHINDDTDGNVLYPDFSNLQKNCKFFHYYFDIDK